MLLCAVAVNNI